MVDAVRTKLAAHGAAPHGDDLMAIDDEERCAAEERRQKRRQKRKDRKRAGKTQSQLAASAALAASTGGSVGGGDGGGGGGGESGKTTTAVAVTTSTAVLGRRTINGSATSTSKPSAKKPLRDRNAPGSKNTAADLLCEPKGVMRGDGGGGGGGSGGGSKVGKEDTGGAESPRASITAGLSSGFAAKVCVCAPQRWLLFARSPRYSDVGVHFVYFCCLACLPVPCTPWLRLCLLPSSDALSLSDSFSVYPY